MLRRTAFLLVGILATLPAGALAALTVGDGSADLGTPLHVPLGRIGDDVAYARHNRSTIAPAWEPAEPVRLVVNGTLRTIDEYAVGHDALLTEWFVGARRQERLFVHLGTRDVVRRDMYATAPGGSWYWNVDLGPRLLPSWREVRPDASLLRLQGMHLQPGLDLSDVSRGAFLQDWRLEGPWIVGVDYQSTVRSQGSIAGERVVEVRTNGTLHLRQLARTVSSTGRVDILSFDVPLGTRVEFARSAWMSGTSAYPLQVHDMVQVEDGPRFETTWTLVRVTSGTTPIPWQERPVESPYARPNPVLARSRSNQVFPDDGDGCDLPYRLGDAVASVESGAAYPGFVAWRQTHPEHYLVGAAGRFTDQVHWYLMFAAPSGDAYAATAFPDPSQAETDMLYRDGPWTVPSFRPSILPRGPITLGAACQILEDFRLDGASSAMVERVRFGLPLINYGATQQHQLALPMGLTHALDVGVRVSEDLVPGSLGRWYNVALLLNASSGEVDRGQESHYEGASGQVISTILPDGPTSRGPATIFAAAPTSPYPLEAALIGYGSLLALFWAFYFYPSLKALAGKLLSLVPGYAKLTRSRLLGHPTRDGLLGAIRVQPGITPPELAKLVPAAWSTLVYHLGVLEKNGLVSSLLDGRHKRYFAAGEVNHSQRATIGVLRHPRTQAAWDAIRSHPGLDRWLVAQRVGTPATSIVWHLERLEAAGLVERRRDGRRIRYFARQQAATQGPPASATRPPDGVPA